MKKRIGIMLQLVLLISLTYSQTGFIKKQSPHDVKTTGDLVEETLETNGLKVFNRIDHSEGAQSVGMELRPTEVIIFGNPKAGTPLMQCRQTVAIDLPQKIVIWKDNAEKVWLAYNDPYYLAKRHGIEKCDKTIKKIRTALDKLTDSSIDTTK